MKFNEVGHYFDLIEQKSSRTAVTELLAELFEQANAREAQIICNLSLGQLHPPYIGTQFNMAEKNLFKVVAQLLGESVEEIKKAKKKTGDIGTPVMDGKWKPIGDPTVVQVYDELCKIEETSGTGSQEKKASELLKLLKSLDPTSAKFVVRIVLGKLRIGFSEMTLVDALSWMCIGDKSLRKKIEHAYNICVDIGLIAARLKKDGIKGIEHMKIEVGIPIRPAAAERLPSAKAIVDKLGDCVAQPKLDGFRLQVHVKKKKSGKREIHFFSRNLQDMSSMFPDLEKVFEKLPIDSLICEGEAIVFDPSTGSFLPFQETVKRKRKHGIEAAMEQLPLQFFIFDLLYLNGESLLSDTHEQRRKMLQDLFKNFKNNVIKVVEEKKIETAKELEDYFNANIAAGLEGLVVKRLDSMYTPGKRNFNWIKLKRQEEGRLDDTLDCVILG
ncbi:ATP-dependent DNA ligase, partial [Candidatus Dependentiae bacterium]|nr:ATP-dependent DNA ligase [Candidatus Dependentiae bacterium]